MIPWELLDRAEIPGGQELRLYRRGAELSVRIGGVELMNSRMHASEDALATLTCARVADRKPPRVLIGGLGMGYTLAAALRALSPEAEVTVAELVPAVVRWNEGVLGDLASNPLRDSRVRVLEDDVGRVIRRQSQAFDAIVLDVDNGPEGLSRAQNDWLYGRAGIAAAQAALRPGGVLAVWSVARDPAFTSRLQAAGLQVEQHDVHAREKSRGAVHTIWLATRAGVERSARRR